MLIDKIANFCYPHAHPSQNREFLIVSHSHAVTQNTMGCMGVADLPHYATWSNVWDLECIEN